MHILLLNQFLPPDSSPTARLLGELGETLTQDGHTVSYVGESGGYRARKTILGSRAIREICSLTRILIKGTTVTGVDVIIGFTSPPLLPFVAYLLALRHRAKLVHWAMDIYPDVAVSLGEVPSGSMIHRVTAALMNLAYRKTRLAVALDEDMEQVLRSHGVATTERCAPWPPVIRASDSSENSSVPQTNRNFTWLYSGNLGRAHEWKTILNAQNRLEKKGLPIELVFQGGGPERAAAQAYAQQIDLNQCRWTDYAPDDQLLTSHLAAQVIIVTQRPETRGLLWPSKLALAFHLPVPIVFVGDCSSSVAKAVTQHTPASSAHAIGSDQALADQVASILANAHSNPPHDSQQTVIRTVNEQRARAQSQWCLWVKNL